MQAGMMERYQEIKQQMIDHPYCKSDTYHCEYGGRDEEGKPKVTALEEFEQKTLEDLWQAVCFEFPPPPPPPGPLAVERNYHQHYVDLRSRSFLGREALIEARELPAADVGSLMWLWLDSV